MSTRRTKPTFIAIRGQFEVEGLQPDGDSLRFRPDNPQLLLRLGKYPKGKAAATLLKTQRVQLRLEAIDTLETHYREFGASHQPKAQANAATDALLNLAGFSHVLWNNAHSRVLKAAPIRGFIASRAFERNGRPVAFAYADRPSVTDGDEFKITLPELKASINYQLLSAGHAYPTFYDGLFAELRAILASEAAAARQAKRGVWAADATLDGFWFSDRTDLMQHKVILPKLFRRLMAYYKALPTAHAAGPQAFIDWMAQRDSDRLTVIQGSRPTGFDNLLSAASGKLQLTLPPEAFYFRG